jgi:hypothetical protein
MTSADFRNFSIIDVISRASQDIPVLHRFTPSYTAKLKNFQVMHAN